LITSGPGQRAVLYATAVPLVCDVLSHVMRRAGKLLAVAKRTSSQVGNNSSGGGGGGGDGSGDGGGGGEGVFDACASDLGFDITAYLYGAWQQWPQGWAHHRLTESPGAAAANALLADRVLAQLTFGVCHLFMQLRAYDAAGTNYDARTWWGGGGGGGGGSLFAMTG
jgi:hypothetical protein